MRGNLVCIKRTTYSVVGRVHSYESCSVDHEVKKKLNAGIKLPRFSA